MKHCDRCGVDVRGNDEYCPLCQNTLSGDGEPDYSIYPNIKTIYRQHKLLFQILMLLTITGGVVCTAVNWMVRSHGWWSFFVILGIICFWIILKLAMGKQRNIPKFVTSQIIVFSLLSIIWDLVTEWHGWSLNYFLPISYTTAITTLAIIARVKKMPAADYIVYLLADIAFGIIPFILYLIGLSTVALPTIICVSCSIVSMATVVIFEGKNMFAEFEKRFHL